MSHPVPALPSGPTARPALRANIKINNVSAWVDARLAGRDPEAILWHRVGKVGEEHGEAVTALIGLTDGNPRRNTSSTTADHLRYELLDVALAALAAHAHLGNNRGDSMQALLDHIDHVHHRAGLDIEAEQDR